jgi:hypothetical protein
MLFAIVPAAAPDLEEPAHYFLPRPDLGETAVLSRVQVDGQGLLLCSDVISIHVLLRQTSDSSV